MDVKVWINITKTLARRKKTHFLKGSHKAKVSGQMDFPLPQELCFIK